MKKQITQFSTQFILALCFAMFVGNIPVLASLEGPLIENASTDMEDINQGEVTTPNTVTYISEEEISKQEHTSEDIIVPELEGIHLSKIEYIGRSSDRCSGFIHNWQLIKTLQTPTCGREGIWKIQCTDCGLNAITYSEVYNHNYVNELCTNCRDGVAPASEISNWDYALNETDQTITFIQYIGDSSDVMVYGKYKINGITYTAILNGSNRVADTPFYSKRSSLSSITINPGVISYNCCYLFYDCNNLTSLDLSFLDTSNVTNMQLVFNDCKNLTSLDLSSFNTSNTTNMYGMFMGCNNLTSLDLSSFDTSNITSMSRMFYKCNNLMSLDLSSFDTSNVTTMQQIFYECKNLTSLDLSHFNTSNTTNMYGMFSKCHNLTFLNLNSFNTSNITSMEQMFYLCSSLNSLDLSSFDTSNITSMNYMFYGCSNLNTLDLSTFMTNNVDTMLCMFYNCTNLTSIYVSRNWNPTFSNTTDMFTNCGTSHVTLKIAN